MQKAQIDLSQQSELTDADFAMIQEIVSCLEPPKLTVYALTKREKNLISAEAALKFCVVQAQKLSSELSHTLAEVLETRLVERGKLHAGQPTMSLYNPFPFVRLQSTSYTMHT